MTGVYRLRADIRRSRRRLHAVIQWQSDTPPPPEANPKRTLFELHRRRRRTEQRQPPRWEYERQASISKRRREEAFASSALTGAGTISVLFDEAGSEPTYEMSQSGIDATYLCSPGANL